jgi:hypothetical protein
LLGFFGGIYFMIDFLIYNGRIAVKQILIGFFAPLLMGPFYTILVLYYNFNLDKKVSLLMDKTVFELKKVNERFRESKK